MFESMLVLPLHILVPAVALATLSLAFLCCFLAPGLAHAWRLSRALSAARQVESGPDAKAAFREIFQRDRQLSHLWKEFQDSLHLQQLERGGRIETVAVRATLPAETSFNSQFVVDSRLWTDFFKHLPGILTGIGIIGTFAGIIDGLQKFQVSDNALTVRTSLEALMHSVGGAFYVSAAAILAAMVVTLVEKVLLAFLYAKTEGIAHAIDAAFDAGAGEEYLARLVRASEDSASQSKILKDALVRELGEVLRELSQAQISASQEAARAQMQGIKEDNQALGAAISESIRASLQEPMRQIADTVAKASGDQSETASRMLQDVMVSFSQRLNELFGGQISGLADLNQQTARSIQDAVSTLQTLVSNLEASSTRSADAMSERMAQAVERLEGRQEAMNAQSAAFVEQIRQLVANSQSETNAKLQAVLQDIGDKVGGLLHQLSESQRQVFEDNASREAALSQRASDAVSGMTASVDGAVKQIALAAEQMSRSANALSESTTVSISRLASGAEDIHAATSRFATAGDRVVQVMGQAASVGEKLTQTSGALVTGATAMQEVVRDYREQRTAISALLIELRSAVDSAKREAALTDDVLSRIEASAGRLGQAQRQADEYLEGVSKVLGEAHTTFASEMKKTLDKANSEFHTKLTSAVSLLSSAVQELEVTLAAMGDLAPARR